MLLTKPMTKLQLSKAINIAVSAALTVQLILPALAQAESNLTPPTTKDASSNKQICRQAGNVNSSFSKRFTAQLGKLKSARNNRFGTLNQRWEKRDSLLTDERRRQDQNRATQFAHLEELAKTDEQKQAVKIFKDAIAAAMKTRRDALDSAITAFRDAFKKAIDDRNTAIDSAVSVYKTAVADAFAKAKTDCANSLEGKDVKTALRDALKTARDTFAADRGSVEKINTSLQDLNIARNEAIKKAWDDFDAARQAAKQELAKAFPQQ